MTKLYMKIEIKSILFYKKYKKVEKKSKKLLTRIKVFDNINTIKVEKKSTKKEVQNDKI